MKKWGKRFTLLALVGALTVVLAACGGNSTGTNETGLSGTIDIDGSSTVFPITEAMAEEFMIANNDVRTSVGTSGTGGGIQRFVKGEISIANASRPIKDTEAEEAKANGIEFITLEVAYDGLTVVVNKDNDFVDKLTVDELKKIYEPNSTVKTWADVREGWPAEEIRIYSPGANHGTFDYFTEEIVGESKAMRNDNQISYASDTNAIVQGVAGDKYSVGFFGYTFFEENQEQLKLVPVDNGTATVTPSMETIKDGSYAPLSRALEIYVNKGHLERPEVKAFVEFYLQNVGLIVEEVGYVPLPQEMYDAQLELIQ